MERNERKTKEGQNVGEFAGRATGGTETSWGKEADGIIVRNGLLFKSSLKRSRLVEEGPVCVCQFLRLNCEHRFTWRVTFCELFKGEIREAHRHVHSSQVSNNSRHGLVCMVTFLRQYWSNIILISGERALDPPSPYVY